MSIRREAPIRNLRFEAGGKRPETSFESKTLIFPLERVVIEVPGLRSKMTSIAEVAVKAEEAPKSVKVEAEDVKPDSRVDRIGRSGKIDLRRLRGRRPRCVCSASAERSCGRRSCRANTSFKIKLVA